jgi:5'-nucleotidase
MTHMQHPLILVDLDMVITDFHGGFENIWKRKFPDRKVVPLSKRKSFYLTKDYEPEYTQDIEDILNAEHFILGLESLPGAVDGFKAMVKKYQHVRICTTSLKNPHSSGEKWRWVHDTFGRKYAEEMIVCNDKTLIKAAYLIDDRPLIRGVADPEWEHILFDQPYNRDVQQKRFTWGDNFDVLYV